MKNEINYNIKFQEGLFKFIQKGLDKGIGAGEISHILVSHATNLGLDLGVDERLISINLLSAISCCFSEDFDRDKDNEVPKNKKNRVELKNNDNTIFLNKKKNVLH